MIARLTPVLREPPDQPRCSFRHERVNGDSEGECFANISLSVAPSARLHIVVPDSSSRWSVRERLQIYLGGVILITGLACDSIQPAESADLQADALVEPHTPT
jgi:hypothetical protein